MKSGMLKRCMAVVLTMALLITSINYGTSIYALETENVIEVTDGQIIAENYKDELAFTEQEVAVLNSESIRGETHKLEMPTAEDNLIEVNSADRKLTAMDYTDELGNVWKPVSAEIEYEQGSESVELNNGQGTYEYMGNQYSVKVFYEAYAEVKDQNTIANIPYYMAKAFENMDVLAVDCYANLSLMEIYIPVMNKMVESGLADALDSKVLAAINKLNSEYEKNGGVFDITNYNDSYTSADNGLEYLLENGKSVKACVVSTYEAINVIAEAGDAIKEMADTAKSEGKLTDAQIKNISRVITQCEILSETMVGVYEDQWKLLEIEAIKADADLDSLNKAAAAVSVGNEHKFIEKNPLVAAKATVVTKVNCYDVTIKVNANVIPKESRDSDELAPLAEQVFTVTLPENSSTEDVLKAIAESGAEESAISIWNWGINEENYVRTATEFTSSLTGDMEYVITYNPVKCALNFTYDESLNKEVYYGYNHTFEVSEDAEVSYDYKVGDDIYMQGEVYFVSGDTSISRTEGKSREGFTLGQLVSEDYSDVLSDKEESILNAKALKTETLSIRVVDNEIKNQIVIDGHNVTANNYDAGYENLSWKPVTVNAVKGEEVIESKNFNGNTAVLENLVYDYAEVVYRLQIKEGDDADVRAVLNLPYVLVSEMASQKADMEQLMTPAVYDNLGSINKTMLNAMAGNLGPESQAAIASILSEEEKIFNLDTNTFYLYEYLNAYKAQGMTYYYSDGHYAQIKGQVEALAKHLSVIANDELLPALLEDLGYGAYKDKIDDAVAQLEALKNGFAAPNAAIDTESEELGALVAALEMEGELNSYNKADGLVMECIVNEASDNTVFVNIQVNVLDSKGQTVDTKTGNVSLSKGQTYDSNAKAAVLNAISTLETALNVDKVNYSCSTTGELPELDSIVEKSVTVVYNWAPAVYSLKLSGTDESFTFSYDNRSVSLPVCEEAGFAYAYTIGGKSFETSAESSKFEFDKFFTLDEFKSLFGNSKELVISREKIDLNRREILALVDSLNNAIAEGASADAENNLNFGFIPVESDGQLNLVLRLTYASETGTLTDTLMDSMMLLVEELMMSKFGYVALNDETFIGDGMVSLQTLVNMVLDNEGFGTGIFTKLVDDKGDIIEADISEPVVVGAENNSIAVGEYIINDTDMLGGQLLTANLKLGSTANSVIGDMPLYITVEDFDKCSKDLLEKKNDVNENYSIEVKDHRLDMVLNLPDSTYMTLAAPLLLNEQHYLADISTITLQQIMDALEEMVQPVLDEGGDLSESLSINPIESQGSYYVFDITASLEAVLSMVEIQDASKNMIKEKDSGINVPSKMTLTNMDESYEAIVLDNANGGLNIVKDAKAAAAEMSKASVMVLLKNIDGDIKFTSDAIINLNGFMVNGSVTSDGELMLINDVMENELYRIYKDEAGNSVIELDSSYLYNKEEAVLKELAESMAYDFVAMNNSWAALSVNGTDIYREDARVMEDIASETVDNMVAFKERISGAGFEALANSFYEMIKNEESALKAAENKTALVNYGVQTTKWDVKMSLRTELVEEKEVSSIITTVKAGDITESSSLSIMIIPTTKPSPTPEITPVVTETPSPTPVVTDTPSPTPTATPVVTETPSPTPEVTPVVTETPSPTPEVTPVVTETPSPTPTATPVVTETPSPTPTATPVVTETPSPTPEVTPVVTETPSPTPTATPEPSETATPEPSETATPELPTATPEPTDELIKLGDVNEDGIIDASDALAVLKHAAKLEELSEKLQKAADVNKDGTIDATDALKILKVAAKIDSDF